jgi:hypothetical protein
MKTMTCRQLGGACDIHFSAETFDEMANQSKKHGMEMYKMGDEPHIIAMQKMQEMMGTPNAMMDWFNDKQNEFNALQEDE